MAATTSTTVVLTRAQRNAIFQEIEYAFESACDLPFMLEDASESVVDSNDVRDLITALHASVGLLDQIGWQRNGDRDHYVIEVNPAVDSFAARIESFALAALEYNGHGLPGSRDELHERVRRLIDADLEKLQAARVLRAAFIIAGATRGDGRGRSLGHSR